MKYWPPSIIWLTRPAKVGTYGNSKTDSCAWSESSSPRGKIPGTRRDSEMDASRSRGTSSFYDAGIRNVRSVGCSGLGPVHG